VVQDVATRRFGKQVVMAYYVHLVNQIRSYKSPRQKIWNDEETRVLMEMNELYKGRRQIDIAQKTLEKFQEVSVKSNGTHTLWQLGFGQSRTIENITKRHTYLFTTIPAKGTETLNSVSPSAAAEKAAAEKKEKADAAAAAEAAEAAAAEAAAARAKPKASPSTASHRTPAAAKTPKLLPSLATAYHEDDSDGGRQEECGETTCCLCCCYPNPCGVRLTVRRAPNCAAF
jgi:hypothetical protein